MARKIRFQNRHETKIEFHVESGRRKPGRPPEPLPKKEFGYLVPLEYVAGKGWLCECWCKRQVYASRRNLIKGITTHCGCRNWDPGAKPLLKRYHFFKILHHKGNKIYALCDCGKAFKIKERDLSETLSCGCIKPGKHLPKNVSQRISNEPIYRTWMRMLWNAKQDRIPVYEKWRQFVWFYAWVMTFTDYLDITRFRETICIYRIDCNFGYEPGNVRIVPRVGVRGIPRIRPRT
jgi:hypothetical protein